MRSNIRGTGLALGMSVLASGGWALAQGAEPEGPPAPDAPETSEPEASPPPEPEARSSEVTEAPAAPAAGAAATSSSGVAGGAATPEDLRAEGTAADREPVSLDFVAHFGVWARTDDEQSYLLERSAGLSAGGGFMVNPTGWLGVGLTFDHADMGVATAELRDRGYVRLTRDLNTVWLDLRVRPVRDEDFAVFFSLGPGFAWQSADAVALVDVASLSAPPQEIACSGSDSASLALRSLLGLELHVSGPFWLSTTAGFEGASLTSEPLDTCVLGSGTVNAVAARAGFIGRADLTELAE